VIKNKKPPLKYVGGKSRLYPEIRPYFTASQKKGLIEPFAGGAAVFFLLSRDGLLTEPSLLNDLSSPVINFYESLRDHHSTLIDNLASFADYHSPRFYSHVSDWDRFDYYSNKQLAARYFYINRAGYNGMYRVNMKGQCNTPWGKKKSLVVNEGNLSWASTALQGAQLSSYDFDALPIDPDKFYFIDPPYSGTFDSYTQTRPNEDFYIRLKGFINRLNDQGAKFLLTNSTDKFIRDLFADYHQKEVDITYSVAGKQSGRKPTKELFVSNIGLTHDDC
jgi:DNA adenine methylase